MFRVGNIEIEKAILLAPMEDVTDLSFRLVCKELGADVVYTEFVNSEGLVRGSEKTHKKLKIHQAERPVGIQIYGGNPESMIEAAKIAEDENPDIIDINAGCWVKNVVGCGAGSALLKDPAFMQKLIKGVVDNIKLPVTVKTRIGWDENSIQILEIAKRLEDIGVAALTVHCRTRKMGHRGEPDWSWIPKIKEVVKIPVVLNGGVFTPEDVKRAFDETNADAVMIARGAIGNPWIFLESKELLKKGFVSTVVDEELKIKTCLRHLKLAIDIKGERRAVIEHRKFYSGYLKGMHHASKIRSELMQFYDYTSVENCLLNYLEELKILKTQSEIRNTII
ncbi:MAG: tRNA dihydrouridine synthase DusB [Ignavibacterium sp.]|jgi:tRNA-dihydrouridine synthase B|uniref:tRNA dihydrouridine synthase DusB n=1 Tax=Ignavibacterium sp. TaxID=2651167 RepID=UPI0032972454